MKQVIQLAFLGIALHLFGCSGCPETAPDPNSGIHGVLIRNPIMVFEDSANGRVVLELDSSTIGRYYDQYLDCAQERLEYHEFRKVYFSDKLGSGFFLRTDNHNEFVLPGMSVFGGHSGYDTSVTVNGRHYADCKRLKFWTDSSKYVMFNKFFGPVVIHYEGEYHWERVLP